MGLQWQIWLGELNGTMIAKFNEWTAMMEFYMWKLSQNYWWNLIREIWINGKAEPAIIIVNLTVTTRVIMFKVWFSCI